MSSALRQEIESANRVLKSVIMDGSGYTASVSDSPGGKKAIYDLQAVRRFKEGSRAVVKADSSQSSKDTRALTNDERESGVLDGSTISGSGVDKSSVHSALVLENDADTASHELSLVGLSQEVSGNGHHEETVETAVGNDVAEDDDDDTFKYKYEFEDDEEGPEPSTSDSSTFIGSSVVATTAAHASQLTLPGTEISSADNRLNDLMLNDGTLTTFKEESTWEVHPSTAYGAKGSAVMGSRFGEMLNVGGIRARVLNDDVMLDLKEVVETIGRPNKRHVHALNLRSVYESYGIAGEPLYTTSVPEKKNYTGVRCTDYIFFSGSSLRPSKILSIPLLTKLSGDNPQESLIWPDPYWLQPSPIMSDLFDNHSKHLPALTTKTGKPSKAEIEAMIKRVTGVLKTDARPCSLWGGKWVPFACPSMTRMHSWLPNDSYASSHISLCAHFQINEDYKATEWR